MPTWIVRKQGREKINLNLTASLVASSLTHLAVRVLLTTLPAIALSAADVALAAPPAYNTVEDEDLALPQRDTLNFTGEGVTCSDDPAGKTTCTIPGAMCGEPRSDGAFHAVDCAAGSSTGGIQEAIDACSGVGKGKCIVQLPHGQTNTSTITVGGLTNSERVMGLVMRGHGSGVFFGTDNDFANCSTLLNFAGTAGDPVIELLGTVKVEVRDLCIDGNEVDGNTSSAAGAGVDIRGNSDTSSTSQRNILHNVVIGNVNGPGLRLAGELPGIDSDQVDRGHFTDLHMIDVSDCIEVNDPVGAGIVEHYVEKLHCELYSDAGIDIIGGGIDVFESNFNGITAINGTVLRIGDNARKVVFVGNGVEIDAGSFLQTSGTQGGTAGRGSRVIMGNRIAVGFADGPSGSLTADYVRYEHAAPLVVAGNTFGLRGAATGANFVVDNKVGGTLSYASFANSIANSSETVNLQTVNPSGDAGTVTNFIATNPQLLEILDNGTSARAAETITPVHGLLKLICSDVNGCDITISESSAIAGQQLDVHPLDNGSTILQIGGQVLLNGGTNKSLTANDSISLYYSGGAWVQRAPISAN